MLHQALSALLKGLMVSRADIQYCDQKIVQGSFLQYHAVISIDPNVLVVEDNRVHPRSLPT
jgi:hypothetical protein